MTEAKEDKPLTLPAELKGEIRFAPDNRLNIAYNPNYTHENESREEFVRDILDRSDKGDRAVCPRCDQQAMRFVKVDSKIGLFGIGACERCGYWYVM
jgi:hypothetical protein